MKTALDREDIIDLLENVIGTEVVEASKCKDNIQYCCQIHGESTASAGISVDKNVFNCFACHARGSVAWLLYKSLPDDFKNTLSAERFLKERYGVDYEKLDRDFSEGIKRFDDFYIVENEVKQRFELPLFKIAPFKSGKETYKYFYDRGFTTQTLIDFKIGRDLQSKTVTIPVFWEDKKLCGIVGRYIDPNRPKNQRYKLYEFPKGSILFPLDKYEATEDNTVILVEGILDALWLHQLGFKNALSILGNGISKEQAKIVKSKARRVIDMFDNDSGGVTATVIARTNLDKDILYYTTEYPPNKKDVQECSQIEIQKMIDNKKSVNEVKIKRL